MAKQEKLWQPQPGPQTDFSQRWEFEVLYGGSKGGGKTDILLMEGLRQINNPRYHACLFRRTFPRLQEIIDRAHMYFPKVGGKWKGAEHRWVFPSGARYDFRHIQTEEDKFNYHGQEFHYMAFDQVEEFAESIYEFMLMQIRTSDPTIRTYVRASANPGGIGHVWVKNRWIDNKEPYKRYVNKVSLLDGRVLEMDSCFIPAKVYDNKILIDANPLYLAQLMSIKDPALKRAMLDGDWDVFAGQYFTEWSRDKHVIEPIKLDPHWKRVISLDWGFNDPSACYWYALAPDSRVYMYRELYESKLKASELGEKICQLSKGESVSYMTASPDMFAKRGGDHTHGESIADILKMKIRDVCPIKPADNDRVNGWQRMREWLSDAPDGKPYLQVFSNCVNLIRTLPSLIRDDHNVEDVDDKCDDHAGECLIAGTQVLTINGEKPIEQITPGELVLTRKGYKRVLYSSITGANEPVFTVTFSNGKTITGTVNHPVFIAGVGFKPLNSIRYGDIIEVANPTKEAISKWLMLLNLKVSNLGVIQTLKILVTGNITGQVATILKKESDIYTTKSGNQCMEKSLKGITFIIKMKTRLIMTSKIWSVYWASTIYQIMQKSCTRTKNTLKKTTVILKKLDHLLCGGTIQKKLKKLARESDIKYGTASQLEPLLAKYAAKSSNTKALTPLSFAGTIASLNGEGTLKLITSSVPALFVEKCSRLISIVKSKLVQGNVVRVQDICPAGTVTVYNLQIEDAPEFYANGILVHNSVRYFCMSRPRPNKDAKSEITGTWTYAELRMKGIKENEIRRLVKSGSIRLIGRMK